MNCPAQLVHELLALISSKFFFFFQKKNNRVVDIKQLYTTFVAYIFGFLNGFVSALDSYSGDPMDFSR